MLVLRTHASMSLPFAETAEVLQYFRNWFNATDIKSLFAGQRTKDANRMSIKMEERNVLQVFHKFGQWLGNMRVFW